MKRCPYCAEEIQPDAIKCRFCGSMLDQQGSRPAGEPCPFCAAPVRANARSCLACGGRLRPGGMGPGTRLALAFVLSLALLFGAVFLVHQIIGGKKATSAMVPNGGTRPDGGVRPDGGAARPPPTPSEEGTTPGRFEPTPEPKLRREGGKSAG